MTGQDSAPAADIPAPAAAPAPVKTPAARPGYAWPLLLGLALIAAAGGGSYLLLQQQQTLQTVDTSLQQALSREQGLRADLNTLQQQGADLAQTATALQVTLNAQQEQLNAQAERVRSLVSTDREDWQLAEAEYLLRLANQRLLMERNPTSALPLLEAADHIVGAVEDVELLLVREALARDLMALRLTPVVDRSGIYVQLAALEQQIDQLPLLQVAAPAPAPAVAPADIPWQQRISASFARVLDSVAAQFSIQHHAQPLEPLLAPDQLLILRQNLRVLLAQAQLAVLREDSMVYHNSLHQVAVLVSRYFSFNPASQPLVIQIQQLAAANIAQTLPDIKGSLDTLRAYNDRRHRLQPAGEPQPLLEAGAAAGVQP
jgi:uroporphyrin-3 C-methyltransferase